MPKKRAKRTKSKKLTKTASRTKPAPPAPVKSLTREQLMDQRAAADFAAMDRVNSDKSVEFRIMNERGRRFEPQPSNRNAASQAVRFDDMTFSRLGATDPHIANSAYMQARRRPGGV